MKTLILVAVFLVAVMCADSDPNLRWSNKRRIGGISNDYATIETDEIGWPARNVLKNTHGRTGMLLWQGLSSGMFIR